jgi:hypothetical protein
VNIRLDWPSGGRDDSMPGPDQARGTTPESLNVLTRNPRTGRYGGGAREGLSAFCSTALGTTGVRAMADCVVDTRTSNYDELATPVELWQGGVRETRAVRVDADGNSYALEGGTHVVVRNSQGVEIDTIVLPVQSSGQKCYALAIDPLVRAFYVGTSEGGSAGRSRLWAYQKDTFAGWRIVWEIEPGAFVAKLAVHAGLLYAGLDDTVRGRSFVVRYENIGTLARELSRSQVPSPVSGLSVNASGRVAVCSTLNSKRGFDPRFPNAGQRLDDSFRSWWLNNLGSWDTRKWTVFDPAELDLDTGDQVFEFFDSEGSERRLTATGESVTVIERQGRFSGQPSNNDTLVIARRDGAASETWTFKSSATAAREVAIGASATLTIANLKTILNNGILNVSEGSALVFMDDTDRVRALIGSPTEPQPELTITITSGTFRFTPQGTSSGATTGMLRAGRVVTTTAPKFRAEGMSGRPVMVFDGKSTLIASPANPTIDANASEIMTALIPGFGAAGALASSARWAVFVACRPEPAAAGSTLLSQRFVDASNNQFTRAICSNMSTAGAFSADTLAVVDRDTTTTRYHVATPSGSKWSLISWVSNPTGSYEVYFNGEEMDNSTTAHTGTAAASDSPFPTRIGQASFFPASNFSPFDSFWSGEVGLIVAIQRSGTDVITTAERQLVEGAIAWYYGEQAKLPTSHPYYSTPPPPADGTVADFHRARQALSPFGNVTVLDGDTQDIAYIVASPETGVGTTSALGGGIAWRTDGNLVSLGPIASVTGTFESVRLIFDQGDDFSLTGAWTFSIGGASPVANDSFSFAGLEMAVDEFDNAYVPWHAERATIANSPPQYVVLDKDGAVLLQPTAPRAQACYSIALQQPRPAYGDETIKRAESIVLGLRRENTVTLTMLSIPAAGTTVTFSGTVGTTATLETYTFVATPTNPREVDIGTTVDACLTNLKAAINLETGSGTLYASSTTRSELVSAVGLTTSTLTIVARNQNATTASSGAASITFSSSDFKVGTGGIARSQLVALVAETGEGRLRQRVAVVDRNIVVFGTDYQQVTSGGSQVTDAGARYWHSQALGRFVFTTDGVRSFKTDIRTRETSLFTATTAGEVPVAAPIFEAYRARLVALAGSRAYYSATGNPFDWDYAPEVVSPAQAWNSGLPPSFDVDDVLNGFAPITDDFAIVFGDHSIWRLTGDPGPGGNGVYDVLTRSMGGAFGRAWCVGPSGELYFWTNEGELAVVRGGQQIDPISGARMREVFRGVDLSKNFIRMAWNYRADRLDIFACPYGTETGSSRWFSWERSVDALWEHEFTGRVVTDAITVDGDKPSDAAVVIGFGDGQVRKLDAAVTKDVDVPIYSSCRFGPLTWDDARLDMMLTELQVALDARGDGCIVEVYSSETARDFGKARRQFKIAPGVSGAKLPRVRGNYVWLVLRGVGGWGFEFMLAVIEAGGQRRAGRLA